MRSIEKRAVLRVCAAALMLCLLAGCGGQDPGTAKDAAAPAESTPTEETASTSSDTLRWINATHAVLTAINGDDYTLFGGKQATDEAKAVLVSTLEEWWGVTDRQSAVDNMEWLLTEGHRADFVSSMRMLEEDGAEEFSREDLVGVLSEMMGDETEGAFLAQSFYDYLEYGEHSIDAWDYSRAMSLLGWYYIAGYYTQSEALDQALELGGMIQNQFSSWDDFMDSYFRGYEYWSYVGSDERRAVYEELKALENGPYTVAWNTPLERGWPAAEDGIPRSQAASEEEWADPFGSYTIPEGWSVSELYSDQASTVYLPDAQAERDLPDNISVEVAQTEYSLEEHERFREDAAALFANTVEEGTTIEGTGTYTAAGDILYVFTFRFPDGAVVTQYYILDDYRYCLINLSNYTGWAETDEAARMMAESFVWTE